MLLSETVGGQYSWAASLLCTNQRGWVSEGLQCQIHVLLGLPPEGVPALRPSLWGKGHVISVLSSLDWLGFVVVVVGLG